MPTPIGDRLVEQAVLIHDWDANAQLREQNLASIRKHQGEAE